MKRNDLLFASNEEIRSAVDRLDVYKTTCSKKNFELRQQATGFTYQEHGGLQDKDLRDIVKPAEQFVHDWQHGIFNNGMSNVLAYLFSTRFRLQPHRLLYTENVAITATHGVSQGRSISPRKSSQERRDFEDGSP